MSRYFQHCAEQDYEDFSQDVMVYLLTSRSLRRRNPGWKGYVKLAIICRAKNRVRDSIHRCDGIWNVDDIDRYAHTSVDTGVSADVRMLVDQADHRTKLSLYGWTAQQIARLGRPKHGESPNTRYSKVARHIREARAALRLAVMSPS